MPTPSGSKVTRAVRGTPSVFAHAIAFVLGGSLAALVTRRPQDDGAASAPRSLPAATTIEADEPEEPAMASWEWAAEPAPQPAEFATEGPAWSPNQVWERMSLEDPDDFEPAPAMPIAPVEDPTPSVAPAPEPEDEPRPRLPHRFAATAAMVTLFFAGAAFSAGAGDQVASMLDTTTTTEATADASSDSAAPAADPAAEPAAPAADSSAADASAAAPAPGRARARRRSRTGKRGLVGLELFRLALLGRRLRVRLGQRLGSVGPVSGWRSEAAQGLAAAGRQPPQAGDQDAACQARPGGLDARHVVGHLAQPGDAGSHAGREASDRCLRA